MTPQPVIQVKNLVARFGDEIILDNISFDVSTSAIIEFQPPILSNGLYLLNGNEPFAPNDYAWINSLYHSMQSELSKIKMQLFVEQQKKIIKCKHLLFIPSEASLKKVMNLLGFHLVEENGIYNYPIDSKINELNIFLFQKF